MRNLLIATTTALALTASVTHAATVVGLESTDTGYVDGVHAYLSGLTFDGVLRWCVSPDLEISLGPQPYVYTDVGALTGVNSLALTEHTLSLAQIGEVGALIGKGYADAASHAGNDALSADAAAIWSVEGAVVSADSVTVQNDILADVAWSVGRSAPFDVYRETPLAGSQPVQNMGGAVPEVSTWALMLVGLGGVGAMVRRRRVVVA